MGSMKKVEICLSATALFVFVLIGLSAFASVYAGSDPSETTNPDEARIIQQTKDAVMKELGQGDWLSQQIELGIEKYIRKLQQAQEAKLAEQQRQANERAKHVRRISITRDHILGDPDAAISLIEYSDFECPYCKRFHPIATQLVDGASMDVNWVYRHFPLPFHNPGAQQEAEAAECANALGGNKAFWAYANALFTRTTSNGHGFPKENLVPLAKELGLDESAFQHCLDSGQETARVKEDEVEGEQIGVNGTPGNILLNNKTGEVRLLTGVVPLAELKTTVAQLLKGDLDVGHTK